MKISQSAAMRTIEEMATKPEETISYAPKSLGRLEGLGHGGEMTHEEAKAWLAARNVFPRVTPVAEPGMWHLRKEDGDYLEFVHRPTGEVVVLGAQSPAAECTSRPDCPCDFCARVRAEIAEGRSEKDEQKKIAEDFLRSYSQTKPAEESSAR